MTGFWPYPFLDADSLGWARVALNTAFLILVFWLCGLLMVFAARRLGQWRSPHGRLGR
jgi:hypothetical protein